MKFVLLWGAMENILEERNSSEEKNEGKMVMKIVSPLIIKQ